MAVDQKKLMGAFGINPVANQSASAGTGIQQDSDDEMEDPFMPEELPEMDSGRTAPVIMNTEAPAPTQQDFNADVDYARRSYANILNEAQKLIQIAMENAESGSSKDLFAAADTIRAASETTERLVTLHEKIQKLQGGGQSAGAGNTFVQNQVVFNGTTEDAMRMVRERIADG